MKKSLLFSVLFLLLFGSTIKAQGYQDPKTIEAINTSATMTVDGLLTEPGWGSAYEYLIFGPNAPKNLNAKSVTGGALVKLDSLHGFSDTTWTKVKFLHQGTKLFIGIESNDKSVCKFGGSWEGDGLFMIIKDAANVTHEFHLYYNALGVNPGIVYEGGGGNSKPLWGFGAGHANAGTIVNDTTQTDNGYTAELVIYLDSLGYTANTTSIPVSIDIFDPDGYENGNYEWGFAGNYHKTWWGSEWGSEFRNLILYQDPPTMTAYTATSAITVDGNLNEPSWSDNYPYLVFGPNPVLTGPNAKSVTSGVLVKDPFKDSSYTTVKFLRSGMNLYFGISSNDKSVCKFGDSWEGDGIFMIIKDAANVTHEFHLYYNASGVNPGIVYEGGGGNSKPQWGNGAGVKGSQTIVNDTTQVDNGYTAELVIYLDSLGYNLSSTTIPVSIDIFDPDGYQDGMGAFQSPYAGSFYKTFWGAEWGSEFRNIILSGTPTPVELVSFTGSMNGENAVLRWTTATESNNKGFEIQRSLDKVNYVTLDFVNGRGTTTEKSSYSYIDKGISTNKIYYRLKQIDFNGASVYSNVVELDQVIDFALLQNYPNPFNPSTVINFSLPVSSNVTIDIYNALGALVKTIAKGTFAPGYHKVDFNGSNLASGLYIYSLKAVSENGKSFVSTKKMTLIK